MNDLKRRLAAGETVIGTFVKTPSPILVEVLSDTDLDFLCLDAEHAPFGRLELDGCVHAARAGGMPIVVRVPTAQPHHLLQALDGGATGVMVPHVMSAEAAADIARAAHFGPGGRGYAGSTRAAGYGTKSMPDHRHDSARSTVVIAQVEDAEVIPRAGAIAATEGVDVVFIGPVDLSVSLGASGPTAPEVLDAIATICADVGTVGRAVGIFATSAQQRRDYAALGVTFFLMQSDHAFLRDGANALMAGD